MRRAGRKRNATGAVAALGSTLLHGAVVAGCGSGGHEPRFERIDLIGRFAGGNPGGTLLIEPGEARDTYLSKVPAFAQLVLRPSHAPGANGARAARLELGVADPAVDGARIAEVFDVGLRPAEVRVDLAAFQGQAASVSLRVPPSSAAVALTECALLVQDRPPNVVLIVVDTLRADLFLSRRDQVDTPNLDRLAADGVPFTFAFSHAPMTLPAHTALFSSRHPHETGVLCNYEKVPQDLPLLADHLEDHGYESNAVISLGTLMPARGSGRALTRGFEHFQHSRGYVAQADCVYSDLSEVIQGMDPLEPFFLFAHFSDPHEPYNLHSEDGSTATIYLDGEELLVATTSDATFWTPTLTLSPGKHELELRSEHDFLVRGFDLRHEGDEVEHEFTVADRRTPTRRAVVSFENPERGAEDFDVTLWITDIPRLKKVPERYVREVEYADRYVGELLRCLEEAGLYNQSLIVFTSDHGEALGERGMAGHVETLHDELLHVPLVFKLPRGFPGKEELRERNRALVRHLDVVPTMLDLLDLPPLPGQRGHSILSDVGERVIISETHKPEAKADQIAIRDLDYKLIYHVDENRFEMFDMKEDRGELVDVFPSRGKEREKWQDRLKLIARITTGERAEFEDLDPETRERLKAIGYGGDD